MKLVSSVGLRNSPCPLPALVLNRSASKSIFSNVAGPLLAERVISSLPIWDLVMGFEVLDFRIQSRREVAVRLCSQPLQCNHPVKHVTLKPTQLRCVPLREIPAGSAPK